MNKRLIIVILVSVIVVTIVSAILIKFELSQYKTYTAVIIGINNNYSSIFLTDTPEDLEHITDYPESVYPNNSYDYAYVLFCKHRVDRIDKIPIKNIEGKKVKNYTLSIGDRVCVVYKDKKFKKKGEMEYIDKEIREVRLIEVVE